MSYNHRNLYKKVIEIQDIVLEAQQRGVTQEWVYQNTVKPRFYISRSTFYRYLAMPAKARLRKLEEAEKEKRD